MKKEIEEQLREIADKFTKDMNRIIDGIEDEPKEQPAPEPVRLWCAKTTFYDLGWDYQRGDILAFESGKITYQRGYYYTKYKTINGYLAECKLQNYLFSLVKRPAKEGEWVRNATTGDVVNVIAVSRCNNGFVYVRSKYHHAEFIGDASDKSIEPPFDYWSLHEYDVIENYHGEYEQPEELLKGAVVCIYSVDERMMKLGKKYLFNNGSTTWENGYKSGDYHSVEELNGNLDSVKIARLIEED